VWFILVLREICLPFARFVPRAAYFSIRRLRGGRPVAFVARDRKHKARRVAGHLTFPAPRVHRYRVVADSALFVLRRLTVDGIFLFKRPGDWRVAQYVFANAPSRRLFFDERQTASESFAKVINASTQATREPSPDAIPRDWDDGPYEDCYPSSEVQGDG
jgi:hypothetical protein